MADAGDAAAAAPLRRSSRAVPKVNYAQLEARADSPPPPEVEAPRKRAKRAASAPHEEADAAAGDADDEDEDELEAGGALAPVISGRITLSTAMSEEFCLTKKQLEALPYDEMPNPHARRSGAPMRLYERSAVLALALRVHGGRAGLDARRAARASRSASARDARTSRTAERRAELCAALAAQGLKLRSDSGLCELYLRHGATAAWPLDKVVRRMAQMKYLHEQTDYVSLLRAIRSDIRDMGGRWDAEETQEEAEQQALPHGYPRVWPWLASSAAGGGAAGAAA